MSPLQTRPFGKDGPGVTIVGLGGEGILRSHGKNTLARPVIEEAAAQGIAYFDSARAYDESERYLGRVWESRPELRRRVFQTSKSARRDYAGAWADLETSLANLHTSSLDLWQMHDLRTEEDLKTLEGPSGALDAFLDARRQGKVRRIGVTGHEDPEILTRAVESWPVDSVLLPVNPIEGVLGGFLDRTIRAAVKKGIAVIGMKVLGQGTYLASQGGITAELLIRYALSQQVTLVIVGCSEPLEVLTLASLGRDFIPLAEEDQRRLEERFAPFAADLAFYRQVI
ncbi:MAG TPA: aldo/keto reductase [Methanomicrobiales archaeon]|nr:aldo/keto reductase [Methanomicrobiales archaeon]